jgi:hypothetical protein
MNHIHNSIALSLCVGATLSTGCAGLDTGNGDITSIEVALSVTSGAPVDSTGTAFTLDSARAHVRYVELFLPTGMTCDTLTGIGSSGGGDYTVSCEGNRIQARGPWSVDLLTGAATPPMPTIPVLPGTYPRFDIRLEKGPDDITLAVTGVAPLDGTSTPFRLALDFDEEARFEGTGIIATEGAISQAILKLDPTAWFAALPLSQCAEEGDLEFEDGILVIEDGSDDCSGVEDAVKEAFKGSGDLRDRDDDRHGDDDDDDGGEDD